MSTFSADWLALREPYDVAARNRTVLDGLAAAFSDRPEITVVDLGCGTGSTVRALSSRLPRRQTWRLHDNDLGLLGRAAARAPERGVTVTTVPLDLARDLETAFEDPVDLITASALLDLVSNDWLDRLIVEAAVRRLPLYAALSYDGRIVIDPPDSFDVTIVREVNRHQTTDKGFGPALGPGAVATAIERFRRVEYAVASGQSDWVFKPADREMQMQILAGWAEASHQNGQVSKQKIEDWLARRGALVVAGASSMRIGHVDFFADPIATR